MSAMDAHEVKSETGTFIENALAPAQEWRGVLEENAPGVPVQDAAGELIVVRQLPIIEERLHPMKERWEQRAREARQSICTDETLKSVKDFRAQIRREFDDIEALRKNVKKAVMAPYEAFEAVYRECVTESFKQADACCAEKIRETEDALKARCEEGLRTYFAELCAVRHLEWLDYERAGIVIDMASARAKTPKRLREQLARFVADVGDSADRIVELDGADEIMVEFRASLDAADAIMKVQERHRRVEEERTVRESMAEQRQREAEAVQRVEAVAAPVAVPMENPKVFSCTFTVHTTMDKLKKLKEFLNQEGIDYD